MQDTTSHAHAPPVVLAIGGHDPGGGAGIQADIEAINAQGARAATLVTALTTQNTVRFTSCAAVDAAAFAAQAAALIADMPIAACKLGLIADAAIAATIGDLLQELPGIPVVMDPVLASGSGTATADASTIAALRRLLPRVTVLTPNTHEALALAGVADLGEAAALSLLESGCEYVLLTGTHADTDKVVNTLFGRDLRLSLDWERLPHTYHGSGCTLAAALAAQLALGRDIASASERAQAYTWTCLKNGVQLGRGQYHPSRNTPISE
jgi:hydroxymethylpyrimidine/phosphomethylpyrimidine kinase